MTNTTTERPDTVHGRLLESIHLAGYTFERACSELAWLLDEDRWRAVGQGFDDINAFLATVDLSQLRHSLEQRKEIARRLAALQASQRATARMLGVGEQTVARDLGKPRGAPNGATALEKTAPAQASDEQPAPHGAWFQSDADPTREAKRVTRNAEREVERAAKRARPSQPLPVGQFALLYADPPWQYEHVATESRAIENQYPTMTLDDLCALDVPAADDAVLFLWATSPKLAEALRVVEAWGFSYRTCAVWDKGVLGMGYYFRQEHELLLVAVRGSMPVPDPHVRPASIIRTRRRGHSEKPGVVYEHLERMYPQLTANTRVELFARTARDGWSSWGNEL